MAVLGIALRVCSVCRAVPAVMHERTCFDCGDWTAPLNPRRKHRYWRHPLRSDEDRARHREWMRAYRARQRAA